MKNNLAIATIDIDSVIFTAFHPNKVMDGNGNPMRTEDDKRFLYVDKTESEIEEACDSLMYMILGASKATHYIGYVKGKNTIKSRLAINPAYKSNRPTESPKFWEFTKQYFIKNWGVIEVNDVEVDDAVNTTRLALEGAYIVAIDGDLLGLETFDKDHFNWRKNEWVTVSKWTAASKFWSDMIKGQKVDGLDGLKGKGPKFVEKLFESVMLNINKYPSAVLNAYIEHYNNEELGIREYYKTYNSLKILDNIEGFVIPEPTEYKKLDKKEDNKFKLDF